ncbi:hypothetical protein [Lacticaseibacillus paracasei]|jgi:hypothetical protein|uniref:hypothetical protein n=1 Tax=Lacticaseibacillus paracasei TaxID=1597 RepID=UPI0031F693D2
MPELKVRDLSEQDLADIESSAKRAHLSREAYLRELIHHDATGHLLSGDVSDLRELTKQMAIIIEQNTVAFRDLGKEIEQLH